MRNICCFLKTQFSALMGPVFKNCFFAAKYYKVYWTDRNVDWFSSRMHGAPAECMELHQRHLNHIKMSASCGRTNVFSLAACKGHFRMDASFTISISTSYRLKDYTDSL